MAVTPREQQVLDLADRGLDTAAIAAELQIRPDYVAQIRRYLAVDPAADERTDENIRRGSLRLLCAIGAAGYATQARVPEVRH